jgi:putative transposase
MPYRREHLCAGQTLHVYNRGVAKQRIFFSGGNYRFFLQRIAEFVQPHAEILAYCLMPNHFHLIVQTKNDKLSAAMQSQSGSYARAINKRLARVGPLFEGRFKSRSVDSEAYLMHLSRYIHQNPVESRIVAASQQWPHSSFREYLSGFRSGLINPQPVLSLFGSAQDYARFVAANDVTPPTGFHTMLFDDANDDGIAAGRNDFD